MTFLRGRVLVVISWIAVALCVVALAIGEYERAFALAFVTALNVMLRSEGAS